MIRTVFAFGFVIILLLFVIRSPAEGPLQLPSNKAVTKALRSVASVTTQIKIPKIKFKSKKSKRSPQSAPAQTTQ